MTTKGASDTMTFRRSTSCPPLSFNFRVFIVLFVFDFIVFLVVERWQCVELHFKIQFNFCRYGGLPAVVQFLVVTG